MNIGKTSKLGKLLSFSVASLVTLLAVILTAEFLIMFNYVQNNNLRTSADSAAKVLENSLASKLNETNTIAQVLHSDSNYLEAIKNNKKDVLSQKWDSIDKTEGMFCVCTNPDNIIVYQTDNITLTADSIFEAIGSGKSGTFSDSQAYIYYRTVIQGDYGTILVGYSLGSDSAVDGTYEQTGNHVTVFYDNLRVATTLRNESGERAVGTTMNEDIYKTVITEGKEYRREATLFGADYITTYMPIVDSNGLVKGALFTGCPMTEMEKSLRLVLIVSITTGVVLVLAAVAILVIFVRRQIDMPIIMAKNMAVEMEHGNLRGNPGITGKLYKNEIGELAEALWSAVKKLDGYVSDISSRMESMANGDFTYESDVEYHGDFESISESAARLREEMNDTINSINQSSNQVYSGSEQISNGSAMLADGTTKQAEAIQELSASIDEIVSNISYNVDNTEKAQALSKNAIELVNSQNEQIGQMLNAMTNIEEKSNEINKIIKTIEDIAFQTNILALNAAVEAARAGAAGKGFAVVADEVRNLANKSAEAASSTTVLISHSIDAVEEGSSIASKTAEEMDKVIGITNETNGLILEIAEKTFQQAEAVNQVKSGIDQISEVVQQNSATAEESAASCEELNAQATILKDKIALFRV